MSPLHSCIPKASLALFSIFAVAGCFAAPTVFASEVNSAAADQSAPKFDATRLRTGTFIYQGSVDGKPGNMSTSTISALPDGHYRFTADIPAFDQSWSTVATRGMSPVETILKMRTQEGRHYVMTLKYAGLHVSGEANTAASEDGRVPAAHARVSGEITANTVDQRIDWATVMTTDYKPGQSFDFQVYDAKTGISRVTCSVSDFGVMTTALGPVHAIKLSYIVYKASGDELYMVYTSRDFPRTMLREDLRGHLVITLSSVKP